MIINQLNWSTYGYFFGMSFLKILLQMYSLDFFLVYVISYVNNCVAYVIQFLKSFSSEKRSAKIILLCIFFFFISSNTWIVVGYVVTRLMISRYSMNSKQLVYAFLSASTHLLAKIGRVLFCSVVTEVSAKKK